VAAEQERVRASLLTEVETAGFPATRESFVPLAAAFRSSHPTVASILVFGADAELLYPFPAIPPSDRDARSRWTEVLARAPEAAALDSLRRSLARGERPEGVLQELGTLAKRGDIAPEIRWEAALSMVQGLRRLKQVAAATQELKEMLQALPPSTMTAGAGGGDVRDDEGYLYHLAALRELAELAREAGDQERAADALLALYSELVQDYGRAVKPQRDALRRYVDAHTGLLPSTDVARREIERLNGLWNERASLERLDVPALSAVQTAVRKHPRLRTPAPGLRDWIRQDDWICQFASVGGPGGLLVGIRVDTEKLKQRLLAIAGEFSGGQVYRIEVSDGEGASSLAGGRRLAELRLPEPFGEWTIAARIVEPSALVTRSQARVRLLGWGVVLLAVGIMLGSWLVVREAASEIRQAKARTDFVSSVSHELRTPLSSMKMLTESLYLGNIPEPDKQRRSLEMIMKETDRLWQLIERVLLFVKLGQDSLVFQFRDEDLCQLVRAAVGAFRNRLYDERVRIVEEFPCEPCPVRADAQALEQVVLNLLDNAVKYSKERKDVRIGVQRTEDRRRFRVSVSDQGIGIRRRDVRRIFRRFYRVRSEETTGIPGVGLGLALCRHIVRAHRGRIEVQSAPGRGSTFSVVIPAAADGG
jgi:signal transduction histidine kinase